MHIPSFKLIYQSMLKKSPENADGRTDGRTDRRTLPRHNTSRFSNGRIKIGWGNGLIHKSAFMQRQGSSVIRPGTLRPRKNGGHFPDGIFQWIFFNENVWISINISLKFVPRGPINNIPTLVQVMAWHQPGDKPLPEPMMITDAYMRHSASMSWSQVLHVLVHDNCFWPISSFWTWLLSQEEQKLVGSSKYQFLLWCFAIMF